MEGQPACQLQYSYNKTKAGYKYTAMRNLAVAYSFARYPTIPPLFPPAILATLLSTSYTLAILPFLLFTLYTTAILSTV